MTAFHRRRLLLPMCILLLAGGGRLAVAQQYFGTDGYYDYYATDYQADSDNAWWENHPYYNEDEWYDPTDWFDNNNYEFDRQAYQQYQRDLRSESNAYGYDTDRTDDWFYDWYDGGYAMYFDSDDDHVYDAAYRYHDFDLDGVYDAYVSYYDRNGDGVYDDVDVFTFGDTGDRAAEWAQEQSNPRSRQEQLQGEIANLKRVEVNDREHLVARIQLDDGKSSVVDLGVASLARSLDLQEGDRITAGGPATFVGDKRILMATWVAPSGGERTYIGRSHPPLRGKVERLRYAHVRGVQNLLVTLRTGGEGERARRVVVDLGPAKNLPAGMELRNDETISVAGPRVRVDDQMILMATRATFQGKSVSIDRDRGARDQEHLVSRRENRSTDDRSTDDRSTDDRSTDDHSTDERSTDERSTDDRSSASERSGTSEGTPNTERGESRRNRDRRR